MRRALASTTASFAAALLLMLALAGTAMAQSATVMTDQADYAPGTIVTITGSGWQPGETVTLQLVESPLIDTHPDMTAVADANGNIFNNQFSPDSYDVAVTFTLTATGSLSGSTAQTTFTDAGSASSGDGTMSVNPTSVTAASAGNNLTFTFQGEPNQGHSFDSGSIVTIDVPSGWSAPQSTNSSGTGFVSVSAGTCSASLSTISGSLITINQTCAGTSTFTFTYKNATVPTAAGASIFTTASRNGTTGTPVNIATSPQVAVIAGPATTLSVTGFPSPVTAGTSNSFAVTAKDANGNVAAGYTGIVKFTSTDGQAVLPGNYQFVAGDNGTHTFTATLKTVGTQSITATDTVTASITGTQSGIVVNAAVVRRGQTIVASLSRKDWYTGMALQ
jgi:hypothetical protein